MYPLQLMNTKFQTNSKKGIVVQLCMCKDYGLRSKTKFFFRWDKGRGEWIQYIYNNNKPIAKNTNQ